MVPYLQYFHNTHNTHVQAAGGAHPWPRPQRSGGIKSRSPETGFPELSEEKFEDDFTSGSGDDKFFTVDPERPLCLPFQRYSLDHHR